MRLSNEIKNLMMAIHLTSGSKPKREVPAAAVLISGIISEKNPLKQNKLSYRRNNSIKPINHGRRPSVTPTGTYFK